MNYEQHNPVPVPAAGPTQRVATSIDTVFDWEYALRQENLLNLYEKGKIATWNATDLDWSVEIDIEKMMRQRQELGTGGMMNQVMNPPRKLDDRELIELNLNMNGFMLSQFLHGEQGALVATA